ncbi:SEC-C metal-binding domain-containing protein [Tahibacter sp.]|uniref:YecA family protein n=1 Tax=Tahibacter sp. TaxID=2056211 RepID=UPI0028C49EBB|nr:SEC-C metal-binding domain-containing protein [Tahibacter sp.]
MNDPNIVPFDFDSFVDHCVQFALGSKDLSEYQARYLRVEEHLFPPPPQGNLRDDDSLRRRIGLAMARAVWCALPLPALDYACPKAPSPERNSPCYCGSGRKFKQCCEPIMRNVPLKDVDLLPRVLAVVPRRTWKTLPGSRVDIDRIAHTADECRRIGDDKAALTLLEPWFASDDSFVARREPLFDMLVDLYFDLDKPRKKKQLLDRAARFGDATLRSGALQRLASMATDRGNFVLAWDLFGQARKIDPNAISLSHLEVTMLFSEGRDDDAKRCAGLWIQRLTRLRDPQLQPLIAYLRDLQRDGIRMLEELDEETFRQRLAAE